MKAIRTILTIGILALLGAGPATQPADPTLDWLLSKATTAPTTSAPDQPDTLPTEIKSVFTPLPGSRDDSRRGSITLSDGRVIKGKLSTTLRQPLHVFIEAEKRFEDVPFSLIQSIEVKVDSETQEREWNWAASGSDIKVYSGKTSPVRITEYTIKQTDGTTLTGSVAAPIYVETAGQTHGYILHKTEKGEVGQAMKDMIYVKSVALTD
jgi:hypothetical protein